jgi:hypothetical protein
LDKLREQLVAMDYQDINPIKLSAIDEAMRSASSSFRNVILSVDMTCSIDFTTTRLFSFAKY